MADEPRSRDVGTLLGVGLDREAARRGAGLPDLPPGPAHTDGATMDPLTQFDLLGSCLGPVIAGLGADDLDRPTPCTDFTVRGVLEHMVGGATAFAAAYRGEAPGPVDLSDPVAGIQAALGELGTAVSAPGALDRTTEAPFGAVDGESFARFVVLDGLVHGWDLATATGQPYDPPAELVAAVDAFARQAVDPLRDGVTFGPAVEPGAGATPMEALAAFTGRTAI